MTQDNMNIREALNEKGGWQVWWRLTRPHTLTASFIPVFVGTMYAVITDNSFHLPLFLAMLIASLLIQIATNMFNEYYDYVRGLDNEQSVGIGGTIVRDGVKPKTVLHLAFLCFGIAILFGIYISAMTSWYVALIGAVSMLIGYLYTGGPMPIAYTPFGELFSGLLMGTVMIGISFFIQTMYVSTEVVIISIPVAILIGSILFSNNIRDRENDAKSGRKTLAILVGHKNAVIILAAAFFTVYVSTLIFIMIGLLPAWSLLTLLSVKKAYDAVNGFIGKSEPLEMMPAMAATAKTNTIYGLLLGLSLFISKFVS